MKKTNNKENAQNAPHQKQDLIKQDTKSYKACKIKIENLSKNFGHQKILENVKLEVMEGESLAIIGGSGSGKSVLLKCILGLMQANDGSSILIDGKEFGNISIAQRIKKANLQFGVLFQGNALFDSLNIWQNIAFKILNNKKLSIQDAKDLAIEKLKAVELDPSIIELFPSEISGGMQKRVAIARAILDSPQILFFDEPTSGLDPVTSKTISILIRKLSDEMNLTSITVTHDLRCMKTIADRVATVADKTVIWQGTLNEINQASNIHPYIKQFIDL